MKVFISWSGECSKKVAQIFRDWLPSVIQSIETFVSSEDIDKGARWNTDIAQELQESTFGIICVTKDNLKAPWLNFEAGALSKTIDNTFVAPFLFDIKPSDLTGSPISQFQATSFNRDDIKKLTETLNTAAGNILAPQRLENTFSVWYKSLEDNLNELSSATTGNEKEVETKETISKSDILEEILETSRNTQRLLGNTDAKLYNNLEQFQKRTEELIMKYEMKSNYDNNRSLRRMRPVQFNKLIYLMEDTKSNKETFSPYSLLIILSLVKNDVPWLYDAGRQFVEVLRSNQSVKNKQKAAIEFKQLLEFITEGHPMLKDAFFGYDKDSYMITREVCSILEHFIGEYINKNTSYEKEA